MTFDALLNILLVVVVPGLMALIGGVLAARALPTEPGKKNPELWYWISGFVFLFLVSIILAFVQQVRSTGQQQAAGQKAAQAELKSSGDIKYMQGQLDTMNKVLGTVAANSDPKQTVSVLQGLLSASTKSTLKKRTLALCSEIEAWFKRYPKPPSVAVPGKPTQKEQADQAAYFQQSFVAYGQRFSVQALSIVQEYGAKGFDVKRIEQQAEYGSLPDDLVIQLRAFANRLDDNGNQVQ